MGKQKLELTCLGQEQHPCLESRILIKDSARSYHARTSRALPSSRSIIFALSIVLVLLGGMVNPATPALPVTVQDKLVARVTDFDNQHKPLIPTLLEIAATYHWPMGIERVVPEAVEQPVSVKLERGTVTDLLDQCILQLPGYAWAVRDGTIHVYGGNEVEEPSNLFNFVLPAFEVSQLTLDEANYRLRMVFFNTRENPGGAVAGSYIGSTELGEKQLSLKAQPATIRSVLNRLTALHGEAVWIARVPPQKLSQLPRAGLWQLLARSTRNPKGIFEFH